MHKFNAPGKVSPTSCFFFVPDQCLPHCDQQTVLGSLVLEPTHAIPMGNETTKGPKPNGGINNAWDNETTKDV